VERGKRVDCYVPRTLRAELKSRGALPADEVIALGLKLSSALAHLHAYGLVHRDVKPSNILFIGGEPKLADAGLVAAVDDARSLVGTAGYITPEGPGTPQADLYALGKVIYEAAFGKDRQEFPALPADVASRSDHARLLEALPGGGDPVGPPSGGEAEGPAGVLVGRAGPDRRSDAVGGVDPSAGEDPGVGGEDRFGMAAQHQHLEALCVGGVR